jgi:hypothetical protein
MAYVLKKPVEVYSGPPCRCSRGYYPEKVIEATGKIWWFQVTSHCKVHWPLMSWGQKLNIIKNENILGDFDNGN